MKVKSKLLIMKSLFIFLIILCFSPDFIDSDSVDGIKIGMQIKEFQNISNSRYRVKKEKIHLEGDDDDIYNVYKNNKIIYGVEPSEKGDKVWRIWIYGTDFKTKEGIGIGNTLGDLKKKYTIKEFSTEGEGHISIIVKELNIGFFLDSTNIPDSWWDHPSLSGLSDNRKIDLIIIT